MSKKYWITKSRYLKQERDAQPHYVVASPHNPVLVTMDDDVKPALLRIDHEVEQAQLERSVTAAGRELGQRRPDVGSNLRAGVATGSPRRGIRFRNQSVRLLGWFPEDVYRFFRAS